MPTSQKDQLAAEAIDRWQDFQESLTSEKRKYPIQQFQAYLSATRRYAELTKADALIHKSVATAVHGLVDFLSAERRENWRGVGARGSTSALVGTQRRGFRRYLRVSEHPNPNHLSLPLLRI
jgi:hypothetical protein